MPLNLVCTCGARFTVEDDRAGREIVCTECRATLAVPAGPAAVARVSLLAVLSLVLALVGALTLVGTVAAVGLGLVAARRIRLRSQQLTGLAFARAGIALGLVFTTLTAAVLASGYLGRWDAEIREAMLRPQIDTSGPLEVRRDVRGFLLQRPSADWGVARGNRVDEPLAAGLRLGKDYELLLVEPGRGLFVDVRKESHPREKALDQIQREYVPAMPPPKKRPWGDRRRAFDEFPAPDDEPRIDEKASAPGTRPSEARQVGWPRPINPLNDKGRVQAGAEAVEGVVEGKVANKSWRMLLRHYRYRDTVFIVRAYARKDHFAASEAELRQCLESFRLLP